MTWKHLISLLLVTFFIIVTTGNNSKQAPLFPTSFLKANPLIPVDKSLRPHLLLKKSRKCNYNKLVVNKNGEKTIKEEPWSCSVKNEQYPKTIKPQESSLPLSSKKYFGPTKLIARRRNDFDPRRFEFIQRNTPQLIKQLLPLSSEKYFGPKKLIARRRNDLHPSRFQFIQHAFPQLIRQLLASLMDVKPHLFLNAKIIKKYPGLAPALISKKQNNKSDDTNINQPEKHVLPKKQTNTSIRIQNKLSSNNNKPSTIPSSLLHHVRKRVKKDSQNHGKIRKKRESAMGRKKRKSASASAFGDGQWMDQSAYRKVFKEYYKCLDKKIEALKGGMIEQIKPILLIVGQSVDLQCGVCMRPDQNPESLGIDWQMLRRADGKMKHVDIGTGKRRNKKRIRLNKDYSLHIRSATITDAGQYFCVVQNNYASVYQLDILLNEKRRVMYEGKSKDKPEPTLLLRDKNLNISTAWTEWSYCDRCGHPGTQRKLGLCMVKKINNNEAIKPIDFPMIDLYPDGIPCHSTALPKFLKKIPEVTNRASETLVRDCLQDCPTTPGPITITDKAGKLVEVIEPGFYSIHHPPTMPPITQRKVIYEDEGKHLVLTCPKAERKVITIWKRNTVVINPLTIRKLTRNRVFVDKASKLHIRKVLISDTSSYLCFLRQQHVATFKLIVYEPMSEHLKDYISIAGMGLTCFSIVIICICICAKKSKQTGK